MAYLGNIIKKLEKHFAISIYGAYNPTQIIDGVQFLMPYDLGTVDYNHRILYLGDYQACHMLTAPAVILLLSAPDSMPHPGFLTICQSTDMLLLFNEIQQEILYDHTLFLKKEELFQSLHSNNGIAGIVNVAYHYLQNSITVWDTSFSILVTQPDIDEFNKIESKNNRFYLTSSSVQHLQELKIIDRIYHSKDPFVTRFDDFPYDFVFGGIRIRHSVISYVCVRANKREITASDLDFISILCEILSVEMQKDSHFSYPTGFKYEYFLTELLEGRLDRLDYIHNQLVQLGHSSFPYYYVLILEFGDIKARRTAINVYYEQILSILPDCMVVFFRGQLTILLPGKELHPFSKSVLSKFEAFLKLNGMYALISNPFSDISTCTHYYKQTRKLLDLNTAKPDESHLIFYYQHFLSSLFQMVPDRHMLYVSIHPSVLEILAYDKANHTEYEHTLRAYLIHNRNAALAAQELHIHKSTFFYRLTKICDLFDIDINSSQTLFAFDYSFHVLDYLQV